MRKLILLFLVTIFLGVHATAQDHLKKVEGSSIYTSDKVFVNEEGEYFAKVFYITFDRHVTENIYQAKDIRGSNVRPEFSTLKGALEELETTHGLQKMERMYPEAVPNDTIRYSKKGKQIVVSDLSLRYKLNFNKLKSLEEVKRD